MGPEKKPERIGSTLHADNFSTILPNAPTDGGGIESGGRYGSKMAYEENWEAEEGER